MAKDTAAPAYSPEDARQAFAPALSESMAPVRERLLGLAAHPPQVLLMEGGTEAERQALARWWAALHHCEEPTPAPCLNCPSCLHIGAGLHLDVLAYDGRITNKEDEENPGPVRAFNMDNARALKARMGDAPRSGGKRVVILGGMDITRDAAANALLKVLEEPSPTTVFVLLAPQREQLLPTLVSRSWVLTLPWPPTDYVDAELAQWTEELAVFLVQGKGWLSRTGARGAVDQDLAQRVVLACQKALITGVRDINAHTPLAQRLGALDPKRRMLAARIFEEAQDALQYNVNPARVLDWLAVRLFSAVR